MIRRSRSGRRGGLFAVQYRVAGSDRSESSQLSDQSSARHSTVSDSSVEPCTIIAESVPAIVRYCTIRIAFSEQSTGPAYRGGVFSMQWAAEEKTEIGADLRNRHTLSNRKGVPLPVHGFDPAQFSADKLSAKRLTGFLL
jgi:hypothetical protein